MDVVLIVKYKQLSAYPACFWGSEKTKTQDLPGLEA
jgi:hypothetical protein